MKNIDDKKYPDLAKIVYNVWKEFNYLPAACRWKIDAVLKAYPPKKGVPTVE